MRRQACAVLLQVLVLAVPAWAAPGTASETGWSGLLRADNPSFAWTGRVAFDSDGSARFDWAAVQCTVRFKGSAISVALEPKGNDIALILDGKLVAIAGTAPKAAHPQASLWRQSDAGAPGFYTLRGLAPGEHLLQIFKRTAPNFGPSTMKGMRLGLGTSLLPPLPRLQRRLEFIGDSLTNGYGNEGAGKQCPELHPYENSHRSYARLASEALQAEPQLLAFSGYGVVRNYGDKERVSKEPFPLYYPRTVLAETAVWDRSKFVPQLAVLNLGSNDFSTEPVPTVEEFGRGYRALLKAIREGRPGLPILCLTPAGRALQTERIRSLAAEDAARGNRTEFLELPPNTDDEFGCDWHPKVVVHERWAKAVEAKIRGMLKW